MRDRVIKVFLLIQGVARKDGTAGQRARWFIRDTGTELYSSKTCETVEEARELARRPHGWWPPVLAHGLRRCPGSHDDPGGTVITDVCQRFTERRESRRPAGEVIRPSEYDVVELGPNEAKAFVERHHYSGSCSPTMAPYGLMRLGAHVGTAVFGPLPSENAHLAVFPTLSTTQGLTLGRLVLTDDVPGNGESYFVARCFELLRSKGVVAIESCADPQPREQISGERIHRGHVGTVYQALSGRYVGKTNPASLRLLPDASVLSNRTQGKLVRGERGQSTALAQLERFGATPMHAGEDALTWLRHWRSKLTRPMRHYGNHRYLWVLDKRRTRELVPYGPRLPYPKIDLQ